MNIDENRVKEIKSKLEEISKTSKELENFLSLNTRFKTLLTEFIHCYLMNNDQSKIKLIRLMQILFTNKRNN